MKIFTPEQRRLVDLAIKRIQTTGTIGKNPTNNTMPLGAAIISDVIIPINAKLTAAADREAFMRENLQGYSNDQVFELTRVMMKSYEEASDKDALRSSVALVSNLYRSIAKRLGFNPKDKVHPPQITELNKIEYQSLLLTRPAGTFKSAAVAICFTMGQEVTEPVLENFRIANIETPSAAPVQSGNKRPNPISIPVNLQATINTASPSTSSTSRAPKSAYSPSSVSTSSSKLFSPPKAMRIIPDTNQVTVDKINNAKGAVELDKLVQLAQNNFASANGKFHLAMDKINSKKTPKAEKARAYLDAISAAKEASVNSSFGAAIYTKMKVLESSDAPNHEISVKFYKSQMKQWADKAGDLMQKAIKAKIPLSQSEHPSPQGPSTPRRSTSR
jgi:hypothetical protein